MFKDHIKIFNVFTKNLNQKINFPQGDKLMLVEEDNFIIVSNMTHLYALEVNELNIQIENLLVKNQIQDALFLFNQIDGKYDIQTVIV